jgi:hypothetical protein
MCITVKEARDLHFKNHGLPLDGGYNDVWVVLTFGFLTFYIPNTRARKKAVPLHDIHHIVTGYASTPIGEAEISAWELAAGIYDKHFARFINLAALLYGFILFPKRTFTAYLRGRNSHTLYNTPFSEALLNEKLKTIQKKLLPDVIPKPTLTDWLYYCVLILLAIIVFILPVIIIATFIFSFI